MGAQSRAQFVFGLEGLALMRQWLTGDEDAIKARVDDILALASTRYDGAAWERIPIPEMEVVNGYAVWAHAYDHDPNPMFPMEERPLRELLAPLPLGRALDAACGTGRHASYLRLLGHEVIGVDATSAMLALAGERATGARWLLGDLQRLPIMASSVDLALCCLALTHFQEMSVPLGELARVVRPGGHIVLSDVHPVSVTLGAQAAFRDPDGGRAFVRNFVHWPSSYLTAFAQLGLEVRRCLEPPWEEGDVAMLLARRGVDVSAEAANAALLGLPAVLIWDLVRT